jgi:hypothetical protein
VKRCRISLARFDRLPRTTWNALYGTQRERCREWRARGPNPDEAAVIAEVEEEMRIHAACRAAYDYISYLMRLP